MTFRNRFYRGIRADIENHKRSVICVGADEDNPSFAYTIGNQRRGLPELLVIGVDAAGAGILNRLSDMMIERGCAFGDSELVSLGGKFPCKVVGAGERAQRDFTIQAGQFFGTETYDVLQVLTPDRDGRFPDEPDCAAPYCDIPVLRKATLN
jgi:hypothetical protein